MKIGMKYNQLLYKKSKIKLKNTNYINKINNNVYNGYASLFRIKKVHKNIDVEKLIKKSFNKTIKENKLKLLLRHPLIVEKLGIKGNKIKLLIVVGTTKEKLVQLGIIDELRDLPVIEVGQTIHLTKGTLEKTYVGVPFYLEVDERLFPKIFNESTLIDDDLQVEGWNTVMPSIKYHLIREETAINLSKESNYERIFISKEVVNSFESISNDILERD